MTEFVLTYRKQDLREIYQDRLTPKLWRMEMAPTWAMTLLFLCLSGVSFYNWQSNRAYLFLTLCFIAVAGYQISLLVRDYLKFKKDKRDIEDWIKSSGTYSTHKVRISETALVYCRDAEQFVYEFDKVKKTYRNQLYFYYETLNNDTLLLPVKAFETGLFVNFATLIDSALAKSPEP